ncbi:hypothetical protein ACNOYE_10120 [Nannocystaceae bacterium ST9]
MQSRSKVLPLALTGLTALALVACSKPAPSEIADRLWISEMPSGPRDRVDAFMMTEINKRAFGSFYQGSLYRGSHDSFRWTSKAKDKGEIEMLQDGRTRAIEIRTCKPSEGFDMCIRLEGDPKGVVRYQSKKRWAVPRRGKSVDVTMVIAELAEEDEELEGLLESAYADE